MKHIYLKSLLTTLLMCMVYSQAYASVKIGDLYYNLDSSTQTAEVTYFSSYSYTNTNYVKGDVVIPSEISYSGITYSVTSIGGYAFHSCYGLTSITIPNSVTIIGEWAFQSCIALTSVTIPNSVTNICPAAFGNCNLTSVTIPNSVTNIGNSAFSDCTALTSVTIPNSVTNIGKSAFSGCTALTSVTIPNSVTNIGESAFKDCTSLTSIDIPNSVTNISWVFEGCTGLISVTIPESMTNIGRSAFRYCTGLTSIDIPNSVTNISAGAFYACRGLTSITIPESVTSIDWDAFYGCSGLTKAEFASLESFFSIDFGNYSSNPLYWAHHLYINGTEITDIVIPNSWTSIRNYAFCNWTGLKSVIIPNSVISIGESAFKECTSLTSITIPNSVRSIGYAAFSGCTKLTYITIPESVTSIGNGAFPSKIRLYTTRKALHLIDLWNQSIIPYDNTNGYKLLRPTTITTEDITASSLKLQRDAIYNQFSYSVVNEWDMMKDSVFVITGLEPNRNYSYTLSISCSGHTYSKQYDFTTKALTMNTLQPKVINEGNVVVGAETNIDDAETNVGFEWRRTDWTDDFQSNTGKAYLYEGAMEGYIRNLNTNYLWKYRPYYESSAGSRYYGDWMGLDPTNTSYFEPTVHTYAQIDVEGNMARVKGYVQRGTDNVTVQGFKYWKTTAGVKAEIDARRISEAEIPDDAITVEAKGQVMTASLKDLDYESSYSYVAFVTTSEGETFYGEQQTFTTGIDTTPVIAIEAETTEATIVARYDIQGRKISHPVKGINILRMSDGTTRKVMVK